MKKIFTIFSFIFSIFALSTSASAADASKSATAILDVNQILTDSKAAKGLNDEISALRAKYEKEIYAKEEELRKEETKLQSLQGDNLEKARKSLETKVASFQKTIMGQQNDLQKAAQDAMDQIREKVLSISATVAKEKGFEYVQPAAGFLHFPEEADITKATIAQLDKQLPKVKVVIKS